MEILTNTYPLQPVNVLQWVVMCTYTYACVLLWPNPRVRVLIGFLALEILLMAFNFSEETKIWGQAYLITPVFTLLVGPSFYLFVRHLVYANLPWKKIDATHAVPALVALPFTSASQSIIALASLSIVAYGVAAFLLLRRYKRASKYLTSDADGVKLDWLVRIMAVFAALGVADAVRLNLQPVLAYEPRNTWYFFQSLAAYLLFLSLIFCALRQTHLFSGLQFYEELTSGANQLPDDNDKSLFEQLDAIVQRKQLFCRQRFSLQDLAEEVGWQSKDVSSVINSGGERNFNDYINALRVAKVEAVLQEKAGQKVNLLDLAFDAGFNSKTNFNTCFKNFTGVTPSQYQKEQLKKYQKTHLEGSKS